MNRQIAGKINSSKTPINLIWLILLTLWLTTGFLARSFAQEIIIPDPGLNAAIRQALQKPSGPLTEQDLLSLTNLSVGGRSISSVEGLQAARNLGILDLDNNSLTNFPIANLLTNLTILDLFNNHLVSFVLSNAPPRLTILDIGFNSLTQCSLAAGLTNLDTLFLEGNALTNFDLPTDLTKLTQLDLSGNALETFTLPPDTTNLITALIFANQLTNLTLPSGLSHLGSLDLDFNRLASLNLPAGLVNLAFFVGRDNQLANLTFPADMTNLTFVDVGGNQLTNLTLPAGLTRLNFLRVPDNKLTTFALPSGMTNLATLFLQNNQLTNLSLSSGLTHLVQIDVRTNNLTNLTLPPDLTNLTTILLDGNPLATFVLAEPLADSNLAASVTNLQNQGVEVFRYPLTPRLTFPKQQPIGAFRFGITGPPGVYAVYSSSNLTDWDALNFVNDPLGGIFFTDTAAHLSPQKFYVVMLQSPPANMVFIPPSAFTMGSPTNDLDSSVNERPQTTVTLTRGYWIGKFEVTQGEYFSLMNTNPSEFPGDLSRPVSSVSWSDATNYCWKLTQQEIAAGHIPPGSRYRLPTEAEWECAARAGTTTRLSYGDDPGYTSLTNYAWFLDLGNPDLTVHPVGQKLPNPLGLYDMYGNVWEWCEDWYGDLPGGSVTDPTGPPSNALGFKAMRGGGYDYPNSSCRSASRLFQSHEDTDLGFRVVLVIGAN